MIKNLKRIGKLLVFMILLATVIFAVSSVLERKYHIRKNKIFMDKTMNYDVLFMGTSHVIDGISPLELYKSYGITSYNMGNYISYMASTYWTLLNAMEVHTPKLVVVDLFALDADQKVFRNIDQVHNAFDAFPLTGTKYRAVNDLFDNFDDKVEMLFPFAKYHSRWNELSSDDFSWHGNYNAGFEIRTDIEKCAEDTGTADEDVLPDQYTVSMTYLEKLIEYCDERNIEVLLCYIPCMEPREEQIYSNYGYVMSEKYDVHYLNLAKYEGLINYHTDFCDEEGHLNVSGARKVTDEIGRYITEQYHIADNRTTDEAAIWNNYYESYLQNYLMYLEAQNAADEYLMMLNNNNFEADICINGHLTREGYPLTYELIDNLEEDGILSSLKERPEETAPGIEMIVRRKDNGEIVSRKRFEMG